LLTSAVGALAALPDAVPFLKGRSQVYAVIRTGGKQYKVKVGDLIDVEKLAGDDGASLELEPLLVVDDDGNVTSAAADLAKAKVTASVVDHHRGKKIRVFTYKNKTRQRRTLGHRQSLTRLKVETIDLGARKRTTRSGGRAKREQSDKQEQEG
jgi:large subunit ribosomal protein L21